MVTGQNHNNELWRMDVSSGRQEKILPGYSMQAYSVSHDGSMVAFVLKDPSNRATLWVAPTDRSSSPVKLSSGTNDDSPFFLPSGDIVFRAVEGRQNFIYHIKADGSGRAKIFDGSMFDLLSISPDGRWVTATSAAANTKRAFATQAIPVEGGAAVPLCQCYCELIWDFSGKLVFLRYGEIHEGSYVLPMNRDTELPKLPACGLANAEEFKKAKSQGPLSWFVPESAVNQSTYAYVRSNTCRNLYRIPLN